MLAKKTTSSKHLVSVQKLVKLFFSESFVKLHFSEDLMEKSFFELNKLLLNVKGLILELMKKRKLQGFRPFKMRSMIYEQCPIVAILSIE